MSLSFKSGGISPRSSTTMHTIGELSQQPHLVLPAYPTKQHFHYNNGSNDTDSDSRWKHLYVLPVLLFEFLALALTRAALPSMLVNRYGDSVYVVMGIADCVRGLLAFIACPLFGKISDVIGRKVCLLNRMLQSFKH